MSSMAHDKTGEGHGKLVRNLLDTLPPTPPSPSPTRTLTLTLTLA